MRVTPFRIDVPDAILADLAVRLDRTRLVDEVDAGDWARGTHRSYLASLVHYWRHEFDWRAQEAKLNELPHRRVHIDGLGIHVIHVRGRGPAPLPLLLTHGYPDSFVRFLDLIPRLTDPAAHGGDAPTPSTSSSPACQDMASPIVRPRQARRSASASCGTR